MDGAPGDPPEELARLLAVAGDGLLSTLSAREDGWPFGSLAPFAPSRTGDPVMLFSGLAEHAKNLAADARASLLVLEHGDGDAQARSRATLLGRVRRLDEAEVRDARARYLERHPDTKPLFALGDFALHVLEVSRVRYVGGFGRAQWLPGAVVRRDPATDPLAAASASVLGHMNDEHAAALATLCAAFKGGSGEGARMVGLDRFGFDVEGAGERHRFDFPAPLRYPEDVRRELVALLGRARRQA